MLWRDLNPDWNFSVMPLRSRCSCSCSKTTFSNTLERKGSLEMGLKLERTEGSRLCFLIRGWTIACLKAVGTQPEPRQVFINVKMCGPPMLEMCFSSLAGILSKVYWEGLHFLTTCNKREWHWVKLLKDSRAYRRHSWIYGGQRRWTPDCRDFFNKKRKKVMAHNNRRVTGIYEIVESIKKNLETMAVFGHKVGN